jgi:hypothetical protein
MDTDWCPEEVLRYSLALFEKHALPCTVFATGHYETLGHYDASRIEIGLHPNFKDTTAEGYEAKLRELCKMYPQAQGVASHAMMSSTPLLHLFKQCGMKYDRNLLRYKDSNATAFYYFNGLLRLPIFWEDDIWFTVEPGVPFTAELLANESFRCIFNFHPIHLYLNTESPLHYQSFKAFQHDLKKLEGYIGKGYGTRNFLGDLAKHIQKHNLNTGLLREWL